MQLVELRKRAGLNVGDAIAVEQQMHETAGQIGGHCSDAIVAQLHRDEYLEASERVVLDVGDVAV